MDINRELYELRSAAEDIMRVSAFLDGMCVAKPDDKKLQLHAELAGGLSSQVTVARVGIIAVFDSLCAKSCD